MKKFNIFIIVCLFFFIGCSSTQYEFQVFEQRTPQFSEKWMSAETVMSTNASGSTFKRGEKKISFYFRENSSARELAFQKVYQNVAGLSCEVDWSSDGVVLRILEKGYIKSVDPYVFELAKSGPRVVEEVFVPY